MKTPRTGLALLALFGTLSARSAHAESAEWGSDSAWTLEEGRLELGLLSASRYGLTDQVELSVHPAWALVLPHLGAKVAWAQSGALRFATEHQLGYPTLFLNLAAKEGALGLLPEHTDVPHALSIENSVLLSAEFLPWLLLSAEFGATVAPRERSSLPLLDFPFLYQRFAALYGVAVPRAGLTSEGALGQHFGYAISSEAFWFTLDPDETGGLDDAWAFEQALRLDYFAGQRFRISAAVRVSSAEFPIGFRTHVLPSADLRLAF